ncbi:hypothetical protein EHI8A_018350 [Entamoeba histolytica HM-1:IMSS-B]|uniref:Uncharacterized protein n=6 Tax=Entamoeba histolytica TaxID=5759 RepID=C4M368_ENTH1|nr:hypothetical protein EHI_086130 [Entamoeba histolytica HM-1:IMSS]EMD46313.1 Hypothetical protein EHI5A_017860 [Entamoeba histolytica KU27]EMH76017.1 hypothetical protein EHI8A_018350 [Entamoeba histolytica HM-1:IMSS-B]EMS15261.1 hypothetical protein KM1_018210 [Entamoeba histolytica HM-3:IMSS]ENY61258.1 hypothetical protein EHI7A_007530 [Entamoeba histolytica HM-1:IMSS-A]GAT95748.1 hypothetical protein CL6EHI_086130 [Entamoeba histolytica]|eukprot:XP_653091.1 hypothetical protein EHI_086130 [Entamoeba histolytica HM-1:IMSS]
MSERIYEIFPEKKRRQRGVQKHWVEEGSIGLSMIKGLGFEGDLKPTNGIDIEFEENRCGIGLVKPEPKKLEFNGLQAVLNKVKTVSPGIIAELKKDQESNSSSHPSDDSSSQEKKKHHKHHEKKNKEHKETKPKVNDEDQPKVFMPRRFTTKRQKEKIIIRSKEDLAGVL